MPRRNRSVITVCLAFVAGLTWYFTSHQITATPGTVSELRGLESQFEKLAANSVGAVVAVKQPNTPGHGTGAIVSSDGLIVSSFHVSHRLPGDGTAPFEHWNAGHTTTVVLADGIELEAELLGADRSSDISLLKLVDPGPYPFLKISERGRLNLGDWILKLGHPTGLQRGRPAVVRMGRVLVSEPEFFVTDCNMTGGDSGGPIIDLSGEIVGIPSALVADERKGRSSHYKWARNKSGSPCLFSAVPARELLSKWTLMLGGKIMPLQEDMSRESSLLHEVNRILPDAQWTRGEAVKEPFSVAVREICRGVVGILDSNGTQVSLGAICSSNGKVVTLKSTLPDAPRCRLASGKIVDCEIGRQDSGLDLAILDISLRYPISVRWISGSYHDVGAFVAAPLGEQTSRDCAFDIGVVSTPKLAAKDGVASEYFEIDMRLPDESHGGPIVNLRGEILGISVRSNGYGTVMIPATQVIALLEYSSE